MNKCYNKGFRMKKKIEKLYNADDVCNKIRDIQGIHWKDVNRFTYPVMFGKNVQPGADVTHIYYSRKENAIIIE